MENDFSELIEGILRIMNYGGANVYTEEGLRKKQVVQFHYIIERSKQRAKEIEASNKKK